MDQIPRQIRVIEDSVHQTREYRDSNLCCGLLWDCIQRGIWDILVGYEQKDLCTGRHKYCWEYYRQYQRSKSELDYWFSFHREFSRTVSCGASSEDNGDRLQAHLSKWYSNSGSHKWIPHSSGRQASQETS